MKLVYLESPYAGDITANVTYARKCMRDSLQRGEAPFASHLLYTQEGILDDTIPEERAKGMNAGFEWARAALPTTVVYTDLGISPGMQRGIELAEKQGRTVEYRSLRFIVCRDCGRERTGSTYDRDLWQCSGCIGEKR